MSLTLSHEVESYMLDMLLFVEMFVPCASNGNFSLRNIPIPVDSERRCSESAQFHEYCGLNGESFALVQRVYLPFCFRRQLIASIPVHLGPYVQMSITPAI